MNSFVLAENHSFVCCYDCNQYWHQDVLDSRTRLARTSCALPNSSDSFFSATTADLGTLHKNAKISNKLYLTRVTPSVTNCYPCDALKCMIIMQLTLNYL